MITAAALLLFTLLCAYLSGDREWANVTKAERNDLVFDGRHQGYGAYILRRDYDRRLMIALFVGFGILGSGILIMRTFFHGAEIPFQVGSTGIDVDLTRIIDPPPAIPDLPPTPPAPARGGTPVPAIGTILMIDTAMVDKDTASTGPDLPSSDTLAAGGGGKGPGEAGLPDGGEGGLGDLGGEGKIMDDFMLQERPSFPGGEAAMHSWLSAHIRYPDRMADAGDEDKVYVEFVVEADGTVSLVKAVKGKHQLSKAEAARVVARFPKWAPGKMNGNAVRCRLTLPVSFRLK